MKLRGYQIDAFTTQPFAGNPAGVIANAENLSDAQMQLIAREFNNSETAFILPPDGNDHDVVIRFFTPTVEVPNCGHATVAAHFVRALETKNFNENLIQKTKAGLMPIRIKSNNGGVDVTITQGTPEFDTPLSPSISQQILQALGTDKTNSWNMPIQVVSTGHSKVMVPLQTREQIDALRPHQADLTAISAEIGCNGFYAFCLNNSEAEHLAYGRMFAPAIGIPEDPVTGNANGPLGAYLVKHGFAQSGNEPFQFSALQGVAMGRPGTMVVSVDRNDCNPLSVTISGTAVKIFQTEFELPGSNEGPTT